MVRLNELFSVKVYFDGGVHFARRGVGPWAELGYAIYPESATSKSEHITAASVGSELGAAVGFWDERLLRLADRLRKQLRTHPASRGPQIYDLVAAHGALVHLRTNGFRGQVRMLTDGQQVVDYLNGNDAALAFDVRGEDIAGELRARIRSLAAEVGVVTWEKVPNRENWVDSVYKGLRRGHLRPLGSRLPPGSRARG